MKLLVTGGCGFLGSNVAAKAIREGVETVLFDNLSGPGARLNLDWLKSIGDVRFLHGDIRSPYEVQHCVRDFQPNAVFHLAGQVAMTRSLLAPALDFEVNALGTVNLLDSVRLYAPKAAVIFSSTNKVYGDLEQYRYRELDTRFVCEDRPKGFDEDTPLNFHSPYGCSKGAADQYMLDYARMFGLKTVVFRHSSMYGSRQFATFDQGWIGWFCSKALEAKRSEAVEPFTISGTGKQVRDALHVEDVMSLYFLALDRIDAIKGQAFNIGGGIENSLSLVELLASLERLTATQLRFRRLPVRESDQRVFVADITKISKALGWKPKVEVNRGIRDMLKWAELTA